jgi:hypothetical protein
MLYSLVDRHFIFRSKNFDLLSPEERCKRLLKNIGANQPNYVFSNPRKL